MNDHTTPIIPRENSSKGYDYAGAGVMPVSVLTIDTFCGLCRAVPVSVLTIDTLCGL